MVIDWSPDPPHNHCDSEVGPVGSSSFTIVGGSSSDSENDEGGDNGYELLPMTPNEECPEDNSEDEENDCDSQTVPQAVNAENSSNEESLMDTCRMDSLQSTSDQRTSGQEHDQEMDAEHVDKIRAAMSGFSLPLNAVPSWAFHIPEEEWHSHLVERMERLQERGRMPLPVSKSETDMNTKP